MVRGLWLKAHGSWPWAKGAGLALGPGARRARAWTWLKNNPKLFNTIQ